MIDSVNIGPGASQGLPINVLTDAAALLYRSEIAGHKVAPALWRDLSDYALLGLRAPGPGPFVPSRASATREVMGGFNPLHQTTIYTTK